MRTYTVKFSNGSPSFNNGEYEVEAEATEEGDTMMYKERVRGSSQGEALVDFKTRTIHNSGIIHLPAIFSAMRDFKVVIDDQITKFLTFVKEYDYTKKPMIRETEVVNIFNLPNGCRVYLEGRYEVILNGGVRMVNRTTLYDSMVYDGLIKIFDKHRIYTRFLLSLHYESQSKHENLTGSILIYNAEENSNECY